MGINAQLSIKPKRRCHPGGVKLLVILYIAVFLFSACTPQQPPSPISQPGVSITYLFTAEAAFDKIEVNQGKLSYTYFDDVNDKCAQWVNQKPCWTEQDLRTKEADLLEGDINGLITLIRQTKFMEQTDSYGGASSEQRAYPHHLKVKLGEVEKEVVYQSFPAAQPMPEAMKKLIDRLHALVNEKF